MGGTSVMNKQALSSAADTNNYGRQSDNMSRPISKLSNMIN